MSAERARGLAAIIYFRAKHDGFAAIICLRAKHDAVAGRDACVATERGSSP